MSLRMLAFLSAVVVMVVGFPVVLAKQAENGLAAATTVEVQEFDRLWRDLGSLQARATGGAAFRHSVVTRTGQYLQFATDQAASFAEQVDLALRKLKEARVRMQELDLRASKVADKAAAIRLRRDGWSQWQQEQRMAADRLLVHLHRTARHHLFAEKRLLWLLRLDHGH